jgi:hypothetical protein
MSATLPYLAWVARGTLVLVFAASVYSKTHGRAAVAVFRHATRTLTGLRGRRADVVAALVVAAETAVAAGSVAAVTALWAGAAAVVLLSLFTWRLAQAGSAAAVACGCFGANTTSPRVGIVRNALLLAVAAVAVASTRQASGTADLTLAGVLVCVVVAVLITAVLVRLNDIAAVFTSRL